MAGDSRDGGSGGAFPWNRRSRKQDDPWANDSPFGGSFFQRGGGGWFGGRRDRNDPFGDVDQITREMDEIFSSLFSGGGFPFGFDDANGGPNGQQHGSVRVIIPGRDGMDGGFPGFGAGSGGGFGRGPGRGGGPSESKSLPPLSAINPALGDDNTHNNNSSRNNQRDRSYREESDGKGGFIRSGSGPGWSWSSWSSSSPRKPGPWDSGGGGGGGGGGGHCVLCEEMHRRFFKAFFEPEKDRPMLGNVNPRYTEVNGSDKFFSDGRHDGFRDPSERRSVSVGDSDMPNPIDLLFGGFGPPFLGDGRRGGGGRGSGDSGGDHNPSLPLPTSPFRPNSHSVEKELPMESYYQSSSMSMSSTPDGRVVKRTRYRDSEGNETEKEEVLDGDEAGGFGQLDWFGGGGGFGSSSGGGSGSGSDSRHRGRPSMFSRDEHILPHSDRDRRESKRHRRTVYDVVKNKDVSSSSDTDSMYDRDSPLSSIVAIPSSKSQSFESSLEEENKRNDEYSYRATQPSFRKPSDTLRDFSERIGHSLFGR